MIHILLFLFGLMVGSFLNVVIDRIPNDEDVVHGRSHCDHCKRQLRWYELIPVFSWFIQQGKSRCCHKSLSIQYPLIEVVTGIGFVVFYTLTISSLQSPPSVFSYVLFYLSNILLYASLLVIFMTDLKNEIIPLHLIAVGFMGVALRLFLLHIPFMTILNVYILPSGIAALFFFFLWFFSKGKAMGEGDMSLVLLLGMITGYPNILIGLYIAFLTGSVVGVILILGHRKTMKSHVPFGPFLILGALGAFVWGNTIITFWNRLW